MKPVIIIAIVFVLITGISITSISAQSQSEIPSWVKNIAGWWSEDKISDEEFLNVVSFLKDSNMIVIPNVEKISIMNYTERILNYSEIISDDVIENDDEITLLYPSVATALANPEKSKIHFPKITGNIENYKSKVPITITITKPNGENDVTKTITNRGEYSVDVFSSGNDIPGIYTVEIKKNEDVLETNYVFLDGTPEKIPIWIKNNARWWSSDQISNDDFLQGIKFLVKTKMITPKKLEILNSSAKYFLVDYLDPMSILDPITMSTSKTQNDNESRQECRARVVKSGLGSAEISKCNKLPSNYKEHVSAVFDLTDPATQERLGRGEFKIISRSIDDLYPSDSGYDYSNHDYSPYYGSNYGYSDADVQRYLDRADYYAKQWLNDIEPYAQKWANGQMSYSEYERLGMQSFDYYSNQFVREFESKW